MKWGGVDLGTGFGEEVAMLELKPDCETCGKALPPESVEAWICSFECTFCTECMEGEHRGGCPNCGGNFEKRPIRPATLLEKFPATERAEG